MPLIPFKDILTELETREGRNSIANRRQKIQETASFIDSIPPTAPQLRGRPPSWFTSSQNAVSRKQVNVEVLGRCIGRLNLNKEENLWIFTPEKTKKALQWSNSPADAKEIRTLIANSWNEGPETNERQIQWSLAEDIGSIDTFKKMALVHWNYPTEIGVSMNRHGATTGRPGNIDLLVHDMRHGGLVYQVVELKNVGIPLKDIHAAFNQALGYAVALKMEATGLPGESISPHPYHLAFGSSRKAHPFRVGAIVVLEDTPQTRAEAKKHLDDFKTKGFLENGIEPLSVLLYKYDSKERKPYGWEWLPSSQVTPSFTRPRCSSGRE